MKRSQDRYQKERTKERNISQPSVQVARENGTISKIQINCVHGSDSQRSVAFEPSHVGVAMENSSLAIFGNVNPTGDVEIGGSATGGQEGIRLFSERAVDAFAGRVSNIVRSLYEALGAV